jgi:hypothetical protein
MIDLNKRSITKQINTKSTGWGIAYNDGSLIYCSEDKGLIRIHLKDNFITPVVRCSLPPLAIRRYHYYIMRHQTDHVDIVVIVSCYTWWLYQNICITEFLLYFQFHWIAHSGLPLRPVYCTVSFTGLSIQDCPFVLCIVLSVSLDH